jgi:hypothetical protein
MLAEHHGDAKESWMYGRSLFGFLAVIVLALVVGVGAYDLGMSQAVVQTGTAAAPAVGYYAPHAFGFWFFPFGFLFPLLFLFLIFGLLRAAFGGGRWGHHGYYGDHRPDVPSRFEEWHQRAHGQTGTAPTDGPDRTDRPAPPRA